MKTALDKRKRYDVVDGYLSGKLKEINSRIKKFKDDLDRDPVNAMVWATGAFEAIGALSPYQRARLILTGTEDPFEAVDRVVSAARRAALLLSENPKFSSSPTSNLIDVYEAKAWASILGDLELRLGEDLMV